MNSKSKAAYGLLAPSLIILSVMTLAPMIYTFVISMFEYDLKKPRQNDFIWFEQYVRVFSDSAFWGRTLTTVLYTLMSVSLTIVLGLALAMLLQKPSRLHTVMKVFLIFPYAISPAVKGYLWRFMLSPDGLLDSVIKAVFPFAQGTIWLSSGGWSLFFLATTEIWGWTPLIALMFVGALGQISPSVFEAAALDGVRNTQMFRYITLPLLSPIIVSTTVLKTIFSLKMFDSVVTMTGGGPGVSTQTINFFIYDQGFSYFKMGEASAMAMVVVLIVVGFVWLYVRSKKREVG